MKKAATFKDGKSILFDQRFIDEDYKESYMAAQKLRKERQLKLDKNRRKYSHEEYEYGQN